MSDIAFVERMEKRWASTSKKRIGDIDQQKLLELARTGAEAADTITALRAENERHQKSFDVRWEASMRAIKRWQEAHPGNDLNWPDHADLVVWLLERDAALRAENERLLAANKDSMLHFDVLKADYEKLRAALKWLADKYDEAMPLRTADFHIPDCTCMRCARDNARAALGEK